MNVWQLTKQTTSGFLKDDAFLYASSIAFSTIFSLPAILIISLSIGSSLYERDTVQQELINQIGNLIGRESTVQIEKIIQNAALDVQGTFARIIGIGTLIFSATTVFISLQTGLNKMWGIKAKPERSWLKFLINRLLSFAMVVSFGFVLLVSLLVDTLVVILQKGIDNLFSGLTPYLLTAFNFILSIAIVTFVFALLFRLLPDAKIKWRDVWVGAFITTLLFTLGKFLIGLYLGNSDVTSAYGAAGSFALILIWVYYSTIIFLYGAEFTSNYATQFGAGVIPYKHAVKIKVVELEGHDKENSTSNKDEAA
jgi:membrane protein